MLAMIKGMSDLFLLHMRGFGCHTECEFQIGGFIMRIILNPVLVALMLSAGCVGGRLFVSALREGLSHGERDVMAAMCSVETCEAEVLLVEALSPSQA